MRADFVLQLPAWNGCCEYAAVPLQALPKPIEGLVLKKKPFSYVVGQADDHNSLQEIAKLVCGDRNAWVPIFEANRKFIAKPTSTIPNLTTIMIPPRQRPIPKLLSKTMPVYPPAALRRGTWGDVVLDVTLKEDGTVERIDVIDGPPMLVDAATSAVKQWRYQPPTVKNKAAKFVVVVSFTRAGKVQ